MKWASEVKFERLPIPTEPVREGEHEEVVLRVSAGIRGVRTMWFTVVVLISEPTAMY